MTLAARAAVPIACWLALAAAAQEAPPVCSSDGQPVPTALLERFISADCAGCWTDLDAPRPAHGQVALDWIVPGRGGDDAPLAAAARDEGVARLQALHQGAPANALSRVARRQGPPVAVRVARGPAFNDYVGTSIELPSPGPGAWRAWLVLVETLPPGTERTPIERNLVRNVLELSWQVGRGPGRPLSETRPMNIPEGARPERLRVVGIVEDARGRVRGIAQSRCGARGPKG